MTEKFVRIIGLGALENTKPTKTFRDWLENATIDTTYNFQWEISREPSNCSSNTSAEESARARAKYKRVDTATGDERMCTFGLDSGSLKILTDLKQKDHVFKLNTWMN